MNADELHQLCMDFRYDGRKTDDEIVERIHKVLDVVPAERVYLTTDCGLKALPRFVAHEKLRALSRAARRVRAELGAPVAA